jgi:hypothetical protein
MRRVQPFPAQQRTHLPGSVQASTCCRMSRLCSAVKLRRVAGLTSDSACTSTSPLRTKRAASFLFDLFLVTLRLLLPRYIKICWTGVSRHLGRGGTAQLGEPPTSGLARDCRTWGSADFDRTGKKPVADDCTGCTGPHDRGERRSDSVCRKTSTRCADAAAATCCRRRRRRESPSSAPRNSDRMHTDSSTHSLTQSIAETLTSLISNAKICRIMRLAVFKSKSEGRVHPKTACPCSPQQESSSKVVTDAGHGCLPRDSTGSVAGRILYNSGPTYTEGSWGPTC